jgi:hypothetical protein
MPALRILRENGGDPSSLVAVTAQSWNFVRRSDAIRLGVTLRGAVLDTGAVASVAIESLLCMGMRQRVLNCLAVADCTQLMGLLV